ncbi:MAG: hypothetical protein J1G04_04240 [Clostridiales bacterium]|nr:hypothetical protein [Clostridiales bacterium]
MKKTKKLLCTVAAISMAIGMGSVLAACNDKDGKPNTSTGNNVPAAATFDIDWNNYIGDLSELYDNNIGNNLPSVSRKTFGDDVYVSTYTAGNGLVVLENNEGVYGYSLLRDRTFGESDELISLVYYGYGVFSGMTHEYKQIIYDIAGTKIAEGEDIYVYRTSVTIDNETKTYLLVTVDGAVKYHEVNEDGTVSRYGVDELPKSNKLPGVGELYTADPESLSEWYGVGEENEDAFMTNTFVRKYGKTWVFTDTKGDEVSRFVEPINMDEYTYVDEHIVYSTLIPVDSMATSGYNFVDDGDKYVANTYSFDIATGETKDISADYVLYDAGDVLYNKVDRAHDVAAVEIYRMVNGVAWADKNYSDSVVINAEGAIGFSAKDSLFGMPMAKIGNNYLYVDSTDFTFSIVDAEGELVSYLGDVAESLLTVLSDGFLVSFNNKLGVVGFDGVVKVGFDYTAASSLYGNYVLVTDDEGAYYTFDVSNNSVRPLSAENMDIYYFNYMDSDHDYHYYCFVRVFDEEKGTFDFYNIDGTKILSNVTSGTFSHYSIFSPTEDSAFMFGYVYVATDTGSQIQYFRMAL